MKKKRRFEFLYGPDRYDGSALRERVYRAATLTEAADKMLRFLKGVEERTERVPWVDEDVIEIIGKKRVEHFLGDHLLRDYC